MQGFRLGGGVFVAEGLITIPSLYSRLNPMSRGIFNRNYFGVFDEEGKSFPLGGGIQMLRAMP